MLTAKNGEAQREAEKAHGRTNRKPETAFFLFGCEKYRQRTMQSTNQEAWDSYEILTGTPSEEHVTVIFAFTINRMKSWCCFAKRSSVGGVGSFAPIIEKGFKSYAGYMPPKRQIGLYNHKCSSLASDVPFSKILQNEKPRKLQQSITEVFCWCSIYGQYSCYQHTQKLPTSFRH